jgi:putative transposase
MLYWVLGNLPGLGTSLVDADDSGSTSNTRQRKHGGSMRQLGQLEVQLYWGGCRNPPLNEVGVGSSLLQKNWKSRTLPIPHYL